MAVRKFKSNRESKAYLSIIYFFSIMLQAGCGAGAAGGGGLPTQEIPAGTTPVVNSPIVNVPAPSPSNTVSSSGFVYDPVSNQCVDSSGTVGTNSGTTGTCSNVSNTTLSNTDLSSKDQTGSTFSGSTLSGVNFGNATLVGANFQKAQLSSVNLWGADLTDASFSGATISNSDISDPIIYDYLISSGAIIGSGNTLPITTAPGAVAPTTISSPPATGSTNTTHGNSNAGGNGNGKGGGNSGTHGNPNRKLALQLSQQRDGLLLEVGVNDKPIQEYLKLSQEASSQIKNLRISFKAQGKNLASNSHLFAEKQDSGNVLWVYGDSGPRGVVGYQIRSIQKGLRSKQMGLASHRENYRILGQKVRSMNSEIELLKTAMTTPERAGFYMEYYATKAKNSVVRFVSSLLG